MDQNDGVARAVILVVELDITRIFFADCDVWHLRSSFVTLGCTGRSERHALCLVWWMALPVNPDGDRE
jgi:hypothetical protein